jgi:heme/copper-type cytochrome/quinol oxidase subunit 3
LEARRLHAFYLLKDSLLPLLVSFNLLFILSGLIEMFESGIFLGDNCTYIAFISLLISFLAWLLEYKQEWSNFVYGNFSNNLIGESMNVRIGFFLFIISEVMFFFSFFFLYFYNSIWTIPEFFGIVWPGANIPILSSISVALPLTVLLLTSSGTINIAIISVFLRDEVNLIINIILTILLGSLFILSQLLEYHELVFGITDGISGSIFFMITGLHGFHVFLGLCFIFLAFIYYLNFSITSNFYLPQAFVFLEVSAWYWHFVDFIWLIVYSWLYDWRILFNFTLIDSFKILYFLF